MGRPPSILKGSGDGTAPSPFSLKGDGDGMATPPFPLKGHDDEMGHSSILPYGKWCWDGPLSILSKKSDYRQSILKGSGDWTVPSPFSLKGDGDGMATSPFYLKENDDGWPPFHSI